MASLDATDKKVATPASVNDASHKASAEANEIPKKVETAKPTEHTEAAKPGDKAPEKPQDAVFKPAVESVGHLQNAKKLSEEISALDKAHTNPKDKITVTGPNGNREITVDERVRELKKEIQTELIGSLRAADNINPQALSQLVRNNSIERAQIAARYGIDLAGGSTPEQQKVLMQERTRALAADPQAAADMTRFNTLQKEAEAYRKAENLPAASRMLYSQYLSAGYANPNHGLDKVDGKMKVDVTDVQLAATLVIQAGRNAEIRQSDGYKETMAKLGDNLGDKDKGELMVKNVAEANKPGTSPERREELLRQAVETSDTLGLRTLAALRHDKEFMDRQPQEVQMRLAATVDGAAAARLEYMRLLVDKGRVGEAEVLMAKTKLEDPDSVGTLRDGKVTYSSQEWLDLDNKLVRGISTGPDDFHKLQDIYNEKVKKGQFTSVNDGPSADYGKVLNGMDNPNIGADKVLEAMQALNRKQSEERVAAVAKLDQEKKSLQDQLKNLPEKKFADDLSRDLEKAELEDKLRAVERSRDDLERVGKQVLAGEDADRLLLSLNRNLGMNERASARADLETLQREHPDLYAKIPADKQKELDDLTKDIPWYKDWKLYAVAGAAVVGAVVGFGVASWATGPAAAAGVAGFLGVSAGTAAIITGAAGSTAAFVAGGAAGGVTYWGAHKTADAFNLSRPDERADFGTDFKKGFAIGSITGSMSGAAVVFKGLGALNGSVAANAERAAFVEATSIPTIEGAAATAATATETAALTTAGTTAGANLAQPAMAKGVEVAANATANALTQGANAAEAANIARTTFMSTYLPNLGAKAVQVGRFLPASASMSVTQEASNHWLYDKQFDLGDSSKNVLMGTAINTLWGGSNLGKLGYLRTPLTSVAAEQIIVGGIEHWGAFQAGSDYNDSNPSSIFGPRFAREAGFTWSNDAGNGLRQFNYRVFGTPNEGPSLQRLDRMARTINQADTDAAYAREESILNSYEPLGPSTNK